MGAGSGKTSTSTTNSPYAGLEAAIGQQIWRTAKPVFQTEAGQTESALQTGGVNSQIPMINSTVAAARESASQSNTQLRQQLAASGLAGSSFGNAILGEEQEQSGQQIGGIPSSIAENFISSGVPGVTGAIGTGVSAIGGAASADTTTESTPSFMQYLLQAANVGANDFGGSQ